MKRFVSVALVVAASAATASAQGASGAAQPAKGVGKVTGTVFDSLVMKPLAGANVYIPGTANSALTDARGRFTLDNIATGRQQIVFSSAGLDSLGLGEQALEVNVIEGKTAEIAMASPSRARLWQLLCGTRTTITSDSGIVFGTLADGDSNVRLAQAPVTFTWYNTWAKFDSLPIGEVGASVKSEASGAYYACGLPTDVQLTTEAFGNKSQTGEVQYKIGERRLLRLDLVASSEMTAESNTRGTATVRGVVLDEKGDAVEDATVFLSGADTTVRTSKNGAFIFRGVPAGTLSLQVRKFGATTTSGVLRVKRGEAVDANVLMTRATTLADVNVTAARKTPEMKELEERQKMGFGMAFDFTKESPVTAVAPLLTVPRVKVSMRTGGAPYITMVIDGGRRRCVADIYLDGRRSSAETISMYPVEQFAAMEVYNSPYQVPAQYMRSPVGTVVGPEWSGPPIRRNAQTKAAGSTDTMPQAVACGVILYWTKAVLLPKG